jgi:L-threonylcarbamoyladenylate synthase
VINTRQSHRNPLLLKKAVRSLRGGGVVVFPTETVYGIAADPRKSSGMSRIFKIKGRQQKKAVAWQVDSPKKAMRLVRKNQNFKKCAEAFWPGPLTLIAVAKKSGKKIGIRVPDHRFAQKLLRAYPVPLAVTSANRSGEKEIHTKRDLVKFFENKVEFIFYETSRHRKASTVVDVSGPQPLLRRPGAVSMKDLNRVIHERP